MKIMPIWFNGSHASTPVALGTIPLALPQAKSTPLAMTVTSPVVATTPVFSTLANAEMPLMVALSLAAASCFVVLPMGLSFVGDLIVQWRKQKPMTGPTVLHHCRIHDPSYLANMLEAEQSSLGFSNQEVGHY
jgi:hypothetical protein